MTDSIPGVFHIVTEQSAGRLFVRAIGELDIAAVEQLRESLETAELAGPDVVVLDLAGVTFIDSAGVRCVLQAVAASQAGADKLRIGRDCSEQVTRLFEMVGAIDRLPYE